MLVPYAQLHEADAAFDRAQDNLRTVLADLEALRPFVDPSDERRAVFNKAWEALMSEAEQAAGAFTACLLAARKAP